MQSHGLSMTPVSIKQQKVISWWKSRELKKRSKTKLVDTLKHRCNVKTDDTTKHVDLNLVFATHGEEDKIYPLIIIEIAVAQRKTKISKSTISKMLKHPRKEWVFNLLKTPKCFARKTHSHSSISTAQGWQLVSPLPPAPWALTSRRDKETPWCIGEVCNIPSDHIPNLADLAR